MKSHGIYRVGLTGGIASGKSTVTEMLRSLGAIVIDTDAIARNLVEPEKLAWSKIREHFGIDAVRDDGTLDRVWLGQRVFEDMAEREWLEELLHPLIREQAEKFALSAMISGQRAIVFDVPLLFESGWQSSMDEIWTVFISRSLQE